MQNMSIYWKKHGSHVVLSCWRRLSYLQLCGKGQALHNAVPFKG